MTQSAPLAATNDAFVFALPPDKLAVEDACFETIVPGAQGTASAQLHRPSLDDENMTIFQGGSSAQSKRPGFGYWLFVALVAVSVFWITGGHALFLTSR